MLFLQPSCEALNEQQRGQVVPIGTGGRNGTRLFAGEGGGGKVDVEKRQQRACRRLRTPHPKLLEAEPRNAGDELDARRLAAKMRFHKVHASNAKRPTRTAQRRRRQPVDNLLIVSSLVFFLMKLIHNDRHD